MGFACRITNASGVQWGYEIVLLLGVKNVYVKTPEYVVCTLRVLQIQSLINKWTLIYILQNDWLLGPPFNTETSWDQLRTTPPTHTTSLQNYILPYCPKYNYKSNYVHALRSPKLNTSIRNLRPQFASSHRHI